MKNFLMIGFAAASMLASSTSHAFVQQLEHCSTQDGRYTVEINNNEGIGPVRTEHLVATITEGGDEIVGSYLVYQNEIGAIGFGHPYLDKSTKGEKFEFNTPDTNVRGYSLRAVLFDGTLVTDDALVCAEF